MKLNGFWRPQRADQQRWLTCTPGRVAGLFLAGVLPFAGCSPEPVPATANVAEPEPPVVAMDDLDPALRSTLATARQRLLTNRISALAWGRYGQALDAADFGTAAQRCYAEAGQREPDSARWPHLLGLRQLREQPDAALENLGRAVKLSGPTNDASRLRLAQALIERGRTGEATQVLQALLTAFPYHPAARLELARASLSLGNAEAIPTMLAPCLTNPFTARSSHILLGQVRLRQGQADAAAKHSEIAASLPKPFDWPDPFLREVQGLRLDARKQAEQANALLVQKRLPEAETVVSNLLARVPEDPEALLLLGRIRLQQRRCADAEAIFVRHLTLRPESPNGQMQLGMACYCQSKWQEAATAFERAIVLKPDFAQAHYNLGLARLRLGETNAAMASLHEARRLEPGSPQVKAPQNPPPAPVREQP